VNLAWRVADPLRDRRDDPMHVLETCLLPRAE